MLSFLWLLYFKEHNFQMYLIYKAKKLKKLKIAKLKKFKPNVFGCLPSSGITNPTFYRANIMDITIFKICKFLDLNNNILFSRGKFSISQKV